MTLIEKRILIKNNKDPTVAAIDQVLDGLYGQIDPVSDKDRNIKKDFFKDKEAEKFAQELKNDAITFEFLRKKIVNEDFEHLSELDLIHVNNAYVYVFAGCEAKIDALRLVKNFSGDMIDKLTSGTISKNYNGSDNKMSETIKKGMTANSKKVLEFLQGNGVNVSFTTKEVQAALGFEKAATVTGSVTGLVNKGLAKREKVKKVVDGVEKEVSVFYLTPDGAAYKPE